MYRLKETPEDFIVKEISIVKPGKQGTYAYVLLKKRSYTTLRAIQHIAERLRIPLRDIGFAGNKDKEAVTEQLISVKNVREERIGNVGLKDIELEFLGYGNKPISLGDLEGNQFRIVARDVDEKERTNLDGKISKEPILMPNYFGEQRFSKNNAEIGKALVKKNFGKAAELILENEKEYKEKIEAALDAQPTNYISALRILPKKLLTLYVNAYQSSLWNETVGKAIKKELPAPRIPMIGFGMEVRDERLKEIIDEIMKRESVTERDFIIPPFPELSAEGIERDAFVEIKNLKVKKDGKNVLFEFFLPKGSYATEAVKFLFGKEQV